ncbi:hypothetical protein BJ741DRAFT_134362 [Chytriomyces cf. hyalinus JEL632]|nr:hypothetical protein BJ741DRAFT_134362 [Chytriomyces cf. hyalinus JEL632]
MNAYWPTTSTVRLNYSFRIQNEANNRCVIQASPSAGQSLRFDDNCDSITTTNLITYSFDNGRLKLVDGKFICPENQTVGSKLRTCINDCEARWEFLPTGNLRHVQTGFCVHPISGGAPASGEEMVIWNDCSATRTPLLYRLAASLS